MYIMLKYFGFFAVFGGLHKSAGQGCRRAYDDRKVGAKCIGHKSKP